MRTLRFLPIMQVQKPAHIRSNYTLRLDITLFRTAVIHSYPRAARSQDTILQVDAFNHTQTYGPTTSLNPHTPAYFSSLSAYIPDPTTIRLLRLLYQGTNACVKQEVTA